MKGSLVVVAELWCKKKRPTRDGETEIALLTNLPEKDAPSVLVAQLYRKRWRVETLFQVATENFHCEIKTLGYPRAALFSFCMALVAYNLFSTLKGILASRTLAKVFYDMIVGYFC
jgi:IS4 transposase